VTTARFQVAAKLRLPRISAQGAPGGGRGAETSGQSAPEEDRSFRRRYGRISLTRLEGHVRGAVFSAHSRPARFSGSLSALAPASPAKNACSSRAAAPRFSSTAPRNDPHSLSLDRTSFHVEGRAKLECDPKEPRYFFFAKNHPRRQGYLLNVQGDSVKAPRSLRPGTVLAARGFEKMLYSGDRTRDLFRDPTTYASGGKGGPGSAGPGQDPPPAAGRAWGPAQRTSHRLGARGVEDRLESAFVSTSASGAVMTPRWIFVRRFFVEATMAIRSRGFGSG